ncbi:helix-turn-helix transcriptional regulator [Gaetbulibacter sp. PBL-D1]|uniref:helix-turn-helix transcriptional regulator n=1 Tax=Gaetbulibacter sp. PBL-D1 TaxID=3422594 RepID=UPI003D2EF16D
MDSLQLFHENELVENIDASLEINTALLDSERQLRLETKKKYVNRYYILGLVIVLLGLISLVVVKYNTFKKRINKFIKKDSEYAYLQSNHEKLKVKVKGLEGYIEDIKHNIKQIAAISDVNDQKNEIKQMYKSIHLNSSTLLNKSENHLELINELNVAFFNKMSSKHPKLTSSDLIICYYIHTGFKNKEISVFLNTTERSIESKRYRIGKKLQLKDKGVSLLDYLTQL